jgi:hypothetical protein
MGQQQGAAALHYQLCLRPCSTKHHRGQSVFVVEFRYTRTKTCGSGVVCAARTRTVSSMRGILQ